ncbi:ArsR family transcriptional regulator [Halosolutus amylolyticus]|uniref:ArsR family transcriptional regulator n=1 Tax=Halosolutus amylolyticus TaxID=2932267 RepID=A0ABD5PUH5_9EURY|nr:ArsR family transcriptional regulator [Halosolutus amylolyticus]
MSSDAPIGGRSTRESPTTVPAECYDALRNPRRLRILEILGSHGARLGLAELTSELLARESRDLANGQARHDVRVSLVHNHLPRLAEYDVVDWDVDTGAELVDSFPIEPAELSTLLEHTDRGNGAAILETVVHPVRLPLCSILADNDRPLSLDELAAELADQDVVADADRARIELHHSHLPALEDASLLEYDADSRLVSETDYSLPTLV